jgi:hypothetical protein
MYIEIPSSYRGRSTDQFRRIGLDTTTSIATCIVPLLPVLYNSRRRAASHLYRGTLLEGSGSDVPKIPPTPKGAKDGLLE